MSPRRLMLSLVVALSLSSLALADSVPVSMTYLHSGAGVYAAPQTTPGHFAPNAPIATSAITPVFNHLSNAAVSAPFSGKEILGKNPTDTTRFAFETDRHGTISHKNGDWAVWHTGAPSPMSTPEPGSLMLLSTGLLGIAGLVRRKLVRS